MVFIYLKNYKLFKILLSNYVSTLKSSDPSLQIRQLKDEAILLC
jgi:hypothetical protein